MVLYVHGCICHESQKIGITYKYYARIAAFISFGLSLSISYHPSDGKQSQLKAETAI